MRKLASVPGPRSSILAEEGEARDVASPSSRPDGGVRTFGPSSRVATVTRQAPASEPGPSPSSRSPVTGVVVVPFPSNMTPVRAVKSTLLMASVAALRESGYYDAYVRNLELEFDGAVLGSVAGTWVDLEAARAHYRACDRLSLTAAEQVTVGQRTGKGLDQHITRLVGVVTRTAEVTPWRLLDQFNRFWARSFDGGGISVVKLGPKEAEIVYARCSLLASTYFRSALRGVVSSRLSIVTQRSFMNELPARLGADEAHYRLSWV
jgi:hypothetical protein